jgi:predicted nucleotidyltransferase
MGIDDSIIDEIFKRILEVIQLDKIIMFGSAAAGTMTPDSDIDLLILEKSPNTPRVDSCLARNNLLGLDYPFDIIIMATERFEGTKDIIGGLAYPANKYGRVIYEVA